MGRPLWVRRRSAWRLWRKNTAREYWPFQAVSQKMQEHVMNMASTPFSLLYGEQCHWKRQWSGRMLPGIWQTRQSRYSGCFLPASNEISIVFVYAFVECREGKRFHPWGISSLPLRCLRHFWLTDGGLFFCSRGDGKGGSV